MLLVSYYGKAARQESRRQVGYGNAEKANAGW